jgi:hypothetical protein
MSKYRHLMALCRKKDGLDGRVGGLDGELGDDEDDSDCEVFFRDRFPDCSISFERPYQGESAYVGSIVWSTDYINFDDHKPARGFPRLLTEEEKRSIKDQVTIFIVKLIQDVCDQLPKDECDFPPIDYYWISGTS